MQFVFGCRPLSFRPSHTAFFNARRVVHLDFLTDLHQTPSKTLRCVLLIFMMSNSHCKQNLFQPLLFQSSHTAFFSARRVMLISVSSTNYECCRSSQGWFCFFRDVKFKLAATACCFPAPHGGFVGAALPSSNRNVEVQTETARFV